MTSQKGDRLFSRQLQNEVESMPGGNQSCPKKVLTLEVGDVRKATLGSHVDRVAFKRILYFD